ncbi:TetR/AcrR family transcriptional regulator [Streptomyces sp. 6N223]|uniref:TetR/AcrR family transcriptional regulator n=1 Tax=Streptomyces sp. 6N223 TaxID=3457412 RepID=UPI003FD497EC
MRTENEAGNEARRGYAKGRARREEIVRAAFRAFAEQGFRATSMREIAEAVGLSQAGLLHHFRSKDQLLGEVLRLRDAEQTEYTDTVWAAEADAVDGELAALRHGLVGLARHNARQAGLVRLYTVLAGESAGADHPARPYFTDRYATVRERVAERVRHVRDAGQLRADVEPVTVAAAIVAAMDGLQVQWLLDPESVDLPEVFAGFLDDYLRGLG